MKQKEVVMGGTYTCYVCGIQAPVVVVGTKAPNSFSRSTRFVVRRVGESVNLPKPRSAAALHPLPPTRAHMCPPNQPTDHIGLPLSYIVPCVREER